MAQYINQVGYGLSSALPDLNPLPVKALRAPTANDVGYPIGQSWIFIPGNAAYTLTSIVNGQANWQASGGGGGAFTTLTTTGQFNLDTTAVAANVLGNTNGATSVAINAGSGGINIGADGVQKPIVIGNVTGNTSLVLAASTGGMNIETANGTIAITSGTGAINVGADGNAKVVTIGNATGTTSVVVNTGTGAASFGANATDHSTNVGSITGVSLTTIFGGTSGIFLSADYVALPGGPRIYTGAGAPAGGLANAVGTMYINTTAASAVTRLYIATAIGTFTNVTCAA